MNPCYNCNKREIGCHSTCIDYSSWRKDYEAKKKQINHFIELETDFLAAKKYAVNRTKKNGGRKR